MTCANCSHYDWINCFCWLRWKEIGHNDAEVSSCSRDDSIEREENDAMRHL